MEVNIAQSTETTRINLGPVFNKTKKSINISENLIKRIEKSLKVYPGLNFTLVVNQALEQWLQGPQSINLSQSHQRFILDNSKGFGPESKK